VSVLLEDRHTLLCLNLDRSHLDHAAALLSAFVAPSEPRPQALFRRYWPEDINKFMSEFCLEHTWDRWHLSKEQRKVIVGLLEQKGYFTVRSATQHVARSLGVSRATVYALLAEARQVSEASVMDGK